MKKNTRRKIIAVLILLLAAALLAGRHFSSRRFRVVAPVAPVPGLPAGAETPVEDTTLLEKEIQPEPAAPESVREEPVEPDETASYPEWFKNMLALHEKYYPSWQSGRSVPAPSSLSGRQAASSASSPGVSPAVTGSGSSISPGGRPGQISTAGTLTSGARTSSAGGDAPAASGFESVTGAAAPYTPADGGGDATPPDEGNGETPPSEDEGGEEEPPQSVAVTITRTINSLGGTINLEITVNSEISGLIISETLPAGYEITSSTPKYAKRRGSEYQWLMYGRTVSSQPIRYTVSGSGGGSITGTYRSTKGSGSITGSNSL